MSTPAEEAALTTVAANTAAELRARLARLQGEIQELLVKAHLADVLSRIPLKALRAHIEAVIEEKVRI